MTAKASLSKEESQDNTDGNETRASECISSQRSNTISPSRNMTFYFNIVDKACNVHTDLR